MSAPDGSRGPNRPAARRSPLRAILLIVVVAGVGWLALAAVMLLVVRQLGGLGGGPTFRHLLGQPAPELAAEGTWVNTDGPLSLADLRGRIVWLEFSFIH